MSEKTTHYPNFADWKNHLIAIQDTGLKIAPCDFFVTNSNGFQQKFFDWYEAEQLEQEVLLPNGWRLPTSKEWNRLIDILTQMLVRRPKDWLLYNLQMKLDGYILHENMPLYRNGATNTVENTNRAVRYWTHNEPDIPEDATDYQRKAILLDEAAVLSIGGGGLHVMPMLMKTNGYCIRAVHI